MNFESHFGPASTTMRISAASLLRPCSCRVRLPLSDDFIGAQQQRLRDRHSQDARRSYVDREVQSPRLLDRQDDWGSFGGQTVKRDEPAVPIATWPVVKAEHSASHGAPSGSSAMSTQTPFTGT